MALNWAWASIRPWISSKVWTMNMSTRSSRVPSNQLLKGCKKRKKDIEYLNSKWQNKIFDFKKDYNKISKAAFKLEFQLQRVAARKLLQFQQITAQLSCVAIAGLKEAATFWILYFLFEFCFQHKDLLAFQVSPKEILYKKLWPIPWEILPNSFLANSLILSGTKIDS